MKFKQGPDADLRPGEQSAASRRATQSLRALVADRRRAVRDRRRNSRAMQKADATHAYPDSESLGYQLIAVQESERARIAADLDDSIASRLVLTKYKLTDALRRVQEGTPRAATDQRVAEIATQVSSTLQALRRIAHNLRPALVEDLGLIAGIRCFALEVETVHERRVQVRQEIEVQEEDIPHALKLAMFRIVQESSKNAIKHGAAKLVRIALRQDASAIQLIVEDDGCGFDVSEALAREICDRAFGIAGMRRRVNHSGGLLAIHSTPGSGTRVVATWPRVASRQRRKPTSRLRRRGEAGRERERA